MQSSDQKKIFLVDLSEKGERLDKILANRFSDTYSRTYFQYLIEKNLVFLNEVPVKKRVKGEPGDRIEVQFIPTPEIELKSESIPLSIIYEDEGMLIVNKPPGMVTHPAPGHWTGTFANALLYYCGELPETNNPLRPGIVHRLDKDTSGLLIAAKTVDMQQHLTNLFTKRQIYKEYLAVCLGKPIDGKICEPIGRHPIHRKQMAIVPGGRQAISTFKTLGCDGKLSAVKATIATGRTHQIRVHLKHAGAAILGDDLYGNPSANSLYGVKRQLLHASILRFLHPKTGEELEFCAPLPEDMRLFFNKILR